MRRGTSGINALIAVNKPCGMTSHDVVSRVRRAVGEKRVGHAGTLDPDASGVLVLGIGQGTRLMGLLTAERKSYIGRITFGSQTTTDDAEGDVVLSAPVPAWATDAVLAQEKLTSLLGTSEQVPPAYSAISVDGVRAYSRARAGQEVELAARPVTIYAAQLISIETDSETQGLSWVCSFEVSKGCYIRSIARDLGKLCDSAAHLSALVRTGSGTIALKDCVALEKLEQEGMSCLSEIMLDPLCALNIPSYVLGSQELADAACGKRLTFDDALLTREFADGQLQDNKRVGLIFDKKLYGVWKLQGTSLICDTNFPVGIEGVRL